MATFAYASDWHLGFIKEGEPLPDFERNADALLLAGDCFDGPKPRQIERFLSHTESTPTVVIPGNHDLYGSRRDKTLRVLDDAFRNTHVTLLANEATVLEGVRIIGTDLWTGFNLYGDDDRDKAMRHAQSTMTDYRKITFKTPQGRFRRLKPADTALWHENARAFIQTQVSDSQQPAILLTHHAPFPESIPARFQGDPLSPAFACDLGPLFDRIGDWPTVCIHGHIHQVTDYRKGPTTVKANPYGYGREEGTGFNASAVVDLPG